jgi:hypothetical protein
MPQGHEARGREAPAPALSPHAHLHRGENWGNLLSTHTHENNHPGLDHVHIPHRDVDKEHRREAHVHDHARPAESPA